MSHDPRKQIGTLIAKHGFNGVESTRFMTGGSVDPAKLRTRMEARGSDLATFDHDDPTVIVAAVIDRVKAQHAAMEQASLLFDAEMDQGDNNSKPAES